MALQALTDDGHMEWTCPRCDTRNAAHISDAAVVVHQRADAPLHHRMVGLPACETCKASTSLKVHFTPAELDAPNFWDSVKGEDGSIVSRTRSASYDVAQRHMQVIQQLDNLGKAPIGGQVAAPTRNEASA